MRREACNVLYSPPPLLPFHYLSRSNEHHQQLSAKPRDSFRLFSQQMKPQATRHRAKPYGTSLQNNMVFEHVDESDSGKCPFKCPVRSCTRFRSGYTSRAWLDHHMRKFHSGLEHGVRHSSSRNSVVTIDSNSHIDTDTDEVDLLIIPADVPRRQDLESSETPTYTTAQTHGDEDEDQDGDKERRLARLEAETQDTRDSLMEMLLEENRRLKAELDSMRGLEDDYKVLKNELGELRRQIEVTGG